MKKLLLVLSFGLMTGFSFSQTSLPKSKFTYYSISEESKAQLKINIDNTQTHSFNLGKIPSITVDKQEKKVTIETVVDKPLGNPKPSPTDSLFFSLLPFHTISITYDIHSDLDQVMLKKDGYDFGYLLTPKSHGSNAVLLFKSRANSNIYDVELVLQTDEEGVLIKSNFLVIGD